MIKINDIKQQLNKTIEKIKDNSNNIEINKIVENLVTTITGAEYSSIWIYDNKSLLFRERDNTTPREVSIEKKKGLLYRCFATKQTIVTNYLASEKEYDAEIDNPDNIKMKSKIMIPLLDDEKFLGIATAYSSVREVKKFDSNDLELFNAVIPFIINAIYKMQSNSCEPKDSSEIKYSRRGSDKVKDTFNKRSTDSMTQLEHIEEQRVNVQTPQEVLDYIANIVHDIRTPSNGLFGFLELLEEQIEDERLKKYISHAKDSASLINELTTSILDGVSTKREMEKSKPITVSPFKYFGDIAEIFSSVMYKKQINYNIFIDPLLPKEITVEGIKLKRIIMNLIGNANKFTAQNQTIEFSVRYKQKDEKIHIFVQDSGIGIAKEKQEQIFEAFKQAQDDTALTYGGTGLGLAISAKYVKELGGKLLLESELDKGSTFYFDISIKVDDNETKFKEIDNKNIEVAILMNKKNSFVANHIARYLVKMGIETDNIKATSSLEKVSSTATHLISFENMLSIDIFSSAKIKKLKLLVVEENFLTLHKENLDGADVISQYGYFAENLYNFINLKRVPKILIVDDDQLSVVLIKTMLSDELCKVDFAYDGMSGLDMIKEAIDDDTHYDIIYSDMNMPLLSGIEMLKSCRALEKVKGLKPTYSVSISGDLDKGDDEFDVYLGKPFNKREIKTMLYNSVLKQEIDADFYDSI